MGAHPYWYIVPFQETVEKTLESLRQREFKAGRYNPAMAFPSFPVTDKSPGPGAKHPTIAAALADSDADGTRSILDIESVSDEPDMCHASPVPPDVLVDFYGTAMPTREMFEENDIQDSEFFEDLERGCCAYVILYKNGSPHEVLFSGVSFD